MERFVAILTIANIFPELCQHIMLIDVDDILWIQCFSYRYSHLLHYNGGSLLKP